MGFHPTNFGLPGPLVSVLELGRGTRQTDRWTDGLTDTGHHFIMPIQRKLRHNKVLITSIIENSACTMFPSKSYVLCSYGLAVSLEPLSSCC